MPIILAIQVEIGRTVVRGQLRPKVPKTLISATTTTTKKIWVWHPASQEA
jgi:hypothetical protein